MGLHRPAQGKTPLRNAFLLKYDSLLPPFVCKREKSGRTRSALGVFPIRLVFAV